MTSAPFTIVFPLFDNVTQLDFTGPAQFLSRLPGAHMHIAAATLEPVMTDCGFAIVPTTRFDDCPPADLLCVPGGVGVAAALGEGRLIDLRAAPVGPRQRAASGAVALPGRLVGEGQLRAVLADRVGVEVVVEVDAVDVVPAHHVHDQVGDERPDLRQARVVVEPAVLAHHPVAEVHRRPAGQDRRADGGGNQQAAERRDAPGSDRVVGLGFHIRISL